MSRSKSEFVKIELRLWHDPRFLLLTPHDRYCYLGMIALAKQTGNKIDKEVTAIKAFLRLDCTDADMQVTLNRLKHSFPKFRSNKHFYYFDGYRERYATHAETQPRNGTGKFYRNGDRNGSTRAREGEKEIEKERENNGAPPPSFGQNTAENMLLTTYRKLHDITHNPQTVLAKIQSALSWGINAGQIEAEMHRLHREGIKAEIWHILDPIVKEKLHPKPDLREDWEK